MFDSLSNGHQKSKAEWCHGMVKVAGMKKQASIAAVGEVRLRVRLRVS
jgi:hypothetical protein